MMEVYEKQNNKGKKKITNTNSNGLNEVHSRTKILTIVLGACRSVGLDQNKEGRSPYSFK